MFDNDTAKVSGGPWSGHGMWHRSTGPGTWHKQHRKSNWAERGDHQLGWEEGNQYSQCNGQDWSWGWWQLSPPFAKSVVTNSTCHWHGWDAWHETGAAWVMLVLPAGCLGQQKEDSEFWAVTLWATGSWFLWEPHHSSSSDSPRWWLQDPPWSTEHRQSVLCHRRNDGDLPRSHPSVSQLWAAPCCFGWDGICSCTLELKAGKRVCLETGYNDKKKAVANSRTSAFTFSKY